MTTKLTLSVDPAVVTRAKKYAKRNGTSVSHLVETYLAIVTKPAATEEETPLVRSLVGVLKKADIKDYRRYLVKKYR